jgi:hypothetical protein
VLTHGSRTIGGEDVEDQTFASLSKLGATLLNSIVVKGPWPKETPRATPGRKGAAPKLRPRKRRRGGWRALAGLTWDQVKDVFEFAKLARQAGFPLNAFFTIKADWRCSTDPERKRDLSRKIAHLGQAIKGRGRTPRQIHFVGATVYEKERNGVLHAHMLVHVENFAFAQQLTDGDIIDVIRARPCHLAYITKQRLPFSPEVEATHWHRRQPSERVVGVRLSFSTDAKALIASQRSREQPAVVAALPQDRPWGIALYERDQERRQRRRSSNRSARVELARSA